MKNTLLTSAVLLASLLGASGAWASNTETTTAQSSDIWNTDRQNSPFWIYGALGAGYGSTSGSEFSNNPDGTSIMAGGLVSLRTQSWVFDLGALWEQTNFSGLLASGQAVSLNTRAGIAEFSPRYRLTQAWDLGPVAYAAFGSNTNFSATDDGTNAAVFAGVKLSYEIPSSVLNLRLTATGTKDVTLSARDVWLFMGGIEIGLPFTGGTRTYAPVHDQITMTKAEPAYVAAPPAPIVKAELRVNLSAKVVYFNTASSRLSPKGRATLKKIGEFLAKNDGAWGALEISGHTDSRGSYKYNLKLSGSRANSVIEELARGGARPSKVKAEAFAFTRPVALGKDDKSLAENRRVELVFKNVSKPELIEREIAKIVQSVEAPKLVKVSSKGMKKRTALKLPS